MGLIEPKSSAAAAFASGFWSPASSPTNSASLPTVMSSRSTSDEAEGARARIDAVEYSTGRELSRARLARLADQRCSLVSLSHEDLPPSTRLMKCSATTLHTSRTTNISRLYSSVTAMCSGGHAQKETASIFISPPSSVVAATETTKAAQSCTPGIDSQKKPSLRHERSVRKPAHEREMYIIVSISENWSGSCRPKCQKTLKRAGCCS
mmetsp:Transcript_35846/g.89198  ORF Transcript_35846/g.89198 Transcript_35846/m.89198 type:complete len:208 (+) Transcript_35846:102-725(+)